MRICANIYSIFRVLELQVKCVSSGVGEGIHVQSYRALAFSVNK